MRAMGPGSVSSFLKTILDVVYFALLAGLGGLVIAGVIGLLISFNADLLQRISGNLEFNGARGDAEHLVPMLLVGLLYLLVYVGALLAIVGRLRRVFATLTAGDPFDPENVRRLRLIGFVLGGMEIARYVFRLIFEAVAPGANVSEDGLNLTAWFAVLVVFVLAEVFREGARLRREAELTI